MKQALFAVLVCLPAACGSPAAHGDASEAGSTDDAADASGDVAAGEVTGLPLPPGVAPPRLLIQGATLTGAGRTACSHQEPASGGGDRWCAFRRDGSLPGTTELWVMDVSAAARGEVPPCDGSSSACLRLTTALWRSYGNDFEGDTLIFYADAAPTLTSAEPYVGPVYSWRPGWARARQLAAHASLCVAHRDAPVAACFDDPAGDPDNPDDVQVRLGVVANVSDATLPALPGRWPFRNDGTVTWQVGFSPDGETFALSTPGAGGGQTLSVIGTRDVATGTLRDHVLDGIQPWTISNDGKKIFFYRGPRTDGTLAIADFPAGTNETVLATKVVDFLALGRGPTDLALLVRVALPNGGGHAFRLLRDRDKPETAATLFTNDGFLEGVAMSADLRYAAWIDPDFRGVAIRTGDLASCAFNPHPAPDVGDVGFLDDGSWMFWSERQAGGGARDGVLAPPERCAERVTYARSLGFVSPVGSRGLVFGDEHDEAERTVTLKYAGFAGGVAEATAGGVRVHEHVVPPVALVAGASGPGSQFVVYQAAPTPGHPAGTYLFGPVPF